MTHMHIYVSTTLTERFWECKELLGFPGYPNDTVKGALVIRVVCFTFNHDISTHSCPPELLRDFVREK